MKKRKDIIGVFDSGVGGLTALQKLAELLPNQDLIYLGDTARVPYGNRSPERIQHYAQECTEFLLEHSVKLILVACNTASSVALSMIEKISSVPVIGVIKPAVNAVLCEKKYKRIGIIGTRATVQSKSYEIQIQQQSQHSLSLHSQACPLFAQLVEEGLHEHPAALSIAQDYLLPLKEANIDALILACTHYPLLKTIIHQVLPGVHLVDSGEEAAIMTSQLIAAHCPPPLNSNTPRKIECYVTDLTPTFTQMAHQFLGVSSAIHQVLLQ